VLRSRDEINYLLLVLLVLFLSLNSYPIYAQLSSGKSSLNLSNANVQAAPSPVNPFICLNITQHLLFNEDTVAVTARYISKTRDGSFLIPGYYYPNNGVYYFMPYLIKSTPEGNILWTKRYFSLGIYPSKWFTATRIKELTNGDLLMTGQIVVPGTDDRRELAVWRLDKNGNLLWGISFESSIWTNPITGATEITGIQEDASGNIYLCGHLKIFEAPKFAFVMKMDENGNVLWDKNFASNTALAFGILLLQNNLFLIGSIGPVPLGPNLNTDVLWCLQLNTGNGVTITTKAWYADFGQQSWPNSFEFANTSVSLLDNGQISVHGSTRSDFQGLYAINPGIINHSIIANFSTAFVFQTGIMLSSWHASNYYNTIATQHANGRISYTRFAENNNLNAEAVIYGSIQNNRIVKERIYQDQSRSSASVSNFISYPPDEDIVIQTYWDQVNARGGLEFFNLRDQDSINLCNGRDTSLTFIQPYYMKETQVNFDSVVTNAFRQTNHNYIGSNDGSLIESANCKIEGINVLASPVVSLDKDSVLCQGSSRELTPGNGFSEYDWNNGTTSPSVFVSDTGRYWVSVTAQNGCKGSDTVYIARMASTPSGFLPRDTTICEFDKLTISTKYAYQSYFWSDQSTGPELTISLPGLYSLKVTDSNHCVGNDSIRLAKKQCLEGLFVPNAFTPNGDGRNDLFRPFLSGNSIGFRFAVYDRWGEKVFETKTKGQGWDGKQNGIPVASGAFVWYCQYQLEGQPQKSKNGTVLLIR
jgi:gliding motility-associated-like protein